MIHLSFSPPKDVAIAVSGGCDSMAVLDFLRKSRNVTALHFNHNTPGADTYQALVEKYCAEHAIPLVIGSLEEVPDEGDSLEDFWRRERYAFFEEARSLLPVITCHHLDDVAETWLFTSLHGTPRLIPSRRGPYLRPFLETRKAVLEDWCERKDVPYIEDPSNEDTRFMRNYIRHELMPKALRVNPGLHKVLRKKIKVQNNAKPGMWEPEWVRSNYEMT